MRYRDLSHFLSHGRAALRGGPVALIFAEDGVALDVTLRHHRHLGFTSVVLFADPRLALAEDVAARVHRVDHDPVARGAVTEAVTRVARATAGTWIYWGFNAEFLFFPFCETRSVGEMLAFHAEERRDAMLCLVADLYAGNLSAAPDGVALDDAWLDRAGYYAQARDGIGGPKERQLDLHGGLRWRFEEHFPADRRRIDRIGLFRAKPKLALREDFTLSDEEMNTYACPWHHNLTATVASFRTAKALRSNPGSRDAVKGFRWQGSTRFDWRSEQLLDLGLMEPGQWF